jgi:hypothetical protein
VARYDVPSVVPTESRQSFGFAAGLGEFVDANGFRVDEFANAVDAEFASVAGLLYPAEWDARVGGDHPVDERHAGFDAVDEAARSRSSFDQRLDPRPNFVSFAIAIAS